MPNRYEGFKVVGAPPGNGRIIQRVQSAEAQKSFQDSVVLQIVNAVKQAILNDSSKELDAKVSALPFGRVQNLAYLRNLETYLSSQLLQVQEEIRNMQKAGLE